MDVRKTRIQHRSHEQQGVKVHRQETKLERGAATHLCLQIGVVADKEPKRDVGHRAETDFVKRDRNRSGDRKTAKRPQSAPGLPASPWQSEIKRPGEDQIIAGESGESGAESDDKGPRFAEQFV